MQRDITNLEADHPGAPARANAMEDVARPRDYPVLLRGEASNKGDVVPRRFLEVLSPEPKRRAEWREGSGRWQLALAIADPKNPLTARVIVNRIWQQHWGRGFVDTPDDLGNMASPPTHPELLDWLAATFVENKWSLKSLHKLIVMSAAYRQSSLNNPRSAEIDPDNRLLWRYNLRRMDFEELHDSLLAITGELDRKHGGKPVPIGSQAFAKRRAVYTMIDRTNPPELLTQFDFPSPDVSSGRRYETLVPQQALFLMNSPMVIETARSEASGGVGPLWIIPREVQRWYGALNQARLALEAIHHFGPSDGIDPDKLAPEKRGAFMRSQFYCALQSALLERVM